MPLSSFRDFRHIIFAISFLLSASIGAAFDAFQLSSAIEPLFLHADSLRRLAFHIHISFFH